MKNFIRFAALAAALAMLLSSCGSKNSDQNKKGDGETTEVSEKTSRTNSKGVPIPNVLDDDSIVIEPTPDPETPLTDKSKVLSYHNSHAKLKFVKGSGKYRNFNPWDDGKLVESLFDGKDGYFNTNEQTKLGGIVNNGELIVEFRTESAVLVGYALVTGNDSGSFPERNPNEWTLSGSNDGQNWTKLDYVYDGGVTASDHKYLGYEIDPDVRAEYSYYQFRFSSDINFSPVTSLQLNEVYLYKDK